MRRYCLQLLGFIFGLVWLSACGPEDADASREQVSRAEQALSAETDDAAICAQRGISNVIMGTPGSDVLRGTAGPDCIVGLGGDDVVFGGGGSDVLIGGPGNDELSGDAGQDFIDGGEGDDIISGGLEGDQLLGGTGDDVIDGDDGSDHIVAGEGNDQLRGGRDGDALDGGEGDDRLLGGDGSDQLYGGTGADFIDGEGGQDHLIGGDCHDVIVPRPDNDAVHGGGGWDGCSGADCEVSAPATACRASSDCGPQGRCVVSNGLCVPTSESVCESVSNEDEDGGVDGGTDCPHESPTLCEDDVDCAVGSVCGRWNGGRFGKPKQRVCWRPSCENGVQDPGEEQVDCGGDCGGCDGVCSPTCDLGTVVPPEAVAVLPFAKGTFERATPATYQVSPSSLETAPANVLRYEDRHDGLGRLGLFEGSRTNFIAAPGVGEEPGWLEWDALPEPHSLVDAATQKAPDGTATAQRIRATKGSTLPFAGTLSGAGDASGTLSVWVRGDETGAQTRVLFVPDSADRAVGDRSAWNLPDGWVRRSKPTTGGAGNVVLTQRGNWPAASADLVELDTANFAVWGMQYEHGGFPSSYIPADKAPALRAADRLTYPADRVPAWLRSGIWQIDVAPLFGSLDLASGEEHVLVGWSGGGISLLRDGTRSFLRVKTDGKDAKHELAWERGTKLTVTINLPAHTADLRGAVSGDGTFDIVATTLPSSIIAVGSSASGDSFAFARLSEIRQVPRGSDRCEPEVHDCSQECPCGSGQGGCKSDLDCDRGLACVAGFEAAYDLPVGTRICRDPTCDRTPSERCGSANDPCGKTCCTPNCAGKQCGDPSHDGCGGKCIGYCDEGEGGCTTDAQCKDGLVCVRGGGAHVGLETFVNVCLAPICDPLSQAEPPNCGDSSALCGACDAPEPDCSGRECGPDGSGGSCGECSLFSSCVGYGHCLEPAEPKIEDAPALPPSATVPGTDATPGSLEVNEDGAAVYTVPIELPPGRHGAGPTIALEYNSQKTRSVAHLGPGWRISGLSMISRCARTVLEDGHARGVLQDADDALCLDGVRLVPVGTGRSIEFRTELDSLVRVIPADGQEGVPNAATTYNVLLPDGTKRVYGTAEGIAVFGREQGLRGTPYLWALVSEVGPRGDTTRYVYKPTMESQPPLTVSNICEGDPDRGIGCISQPLYESQKFTGDLRITAIHYGGHTCTRGPCSGGEQPDHLSLKFIYEPFDTVEGNDPEPLTRLETFVDDQLVRSYALHYTEYNRSRVRLSTLEECDGASVCKGKTFFGYTPVSPGVNEATLLPDVGPNSIADINNINIYQHNVYALDANGDGLDDLLWPGKDSAARGSDDWQLLLSELDGDGNIRTDVEPRSVHLPETVMASLHVGTLNVDHRVSPGDFNGDGMQDVAVESINEDTDRSRLDIYTSTGTDFTQWMQIEFSAHYPPSFSDEIPDDRSTWVSYDADGDGWQDIAVCEPDEKLWRFFWNDQGDFATNTSVPTPHGCDHFFLVDVDRDGASELLSFADNSIDDDYGYFFALRLAGRDTGEWFNTYLSSADRLAGTAHTLDADGDGRMDVMTDVSFTAPYCYDWDNDGEINYPCTHTEFHTAAQLWQNRPWGFDAPARELELKSYNTGVHNVDDFASGASYMRSFGYDIDGDGVDELLFPQIFQMPEDGGDLSHYTGKWFAHRAEAVFAGRSRVESFITPVDLGIDIATQRGTIPLTQDYDRWWMGPGSVKLVPADVNGDGSPDLVQVYNPSKKDGSGHWVLAAKSNLRVWRVEQEANLISRIEDGLGHVDDIDYARPADRTVYEPASSCPDHDSVCLRKLLRGTVAKHVELDRSHFGDPSRHLTRDFFYFDGRVERGGRGALGFKRRAIRESGDGHETFTVVTYDPDHRDVTIHDDTQSMAPFARIPKTVATIAKVEQGTLTGDNTKSIYRLTSTDIAWNLRSSDVKIPFAFRDTQTTRVFEERVSAMPEFNRANVSLEPLFTQGAISLSFHDFTVDGFNNVTSVVTDDYGAANRDNAAARVRRVSTTMAYAPTSSELSAWQLRYPKSRLTSYTSGSVTKTQFETYRYTDGFLTELTRAHDEDEESFLTVVFTPDAFRNVRTIETSDPLQEETRAVTFTYDARNIHAATATYHVGLDKEPLTTEYDFSDAFGSLRVIKDPAGVVESFSYDGFGRLAWHSESSGLQTRYRYISRLSDDTPRELRELCDDCEVWRVAESGKGDFGERPVGDGEEMSGYDAFGNERVRRFRGLGNAWVMQTVDYDVFGRTVRETMPHLDGDATQGAKEFRYDDIGRPTWMSDGVANVEYSYASRHTISGSQDLIAMPAGGLWAQDAVRWFTSMHESGGGSSAVVASDALDRPIVRKDGSDVRRYAYDARDSIRRVLFDGNASQTRESETDGWGRLIRIKDPDAGQHNYEYYGTGEVREQTLPGGISITFTYDAVGRLLTRTAPGEFQELHWDSDEERAYPGRLLRAEGTDHVRRYWYKDRTNLLERMTDNVVAEAFTTAFEYDDIGRLDVLRYPARGSASLNVRYGYDEHGHPTSLSDADHSTDPQDDDYKRPFWSFVSGDQGYRLKREQLGNGAFVERRYEEDRGYLKSVTVERGGASVASWRLQHDAQGRRESISRGEDPDEPFFLNTKRYSYTPTGRLERVTDGSPIVSRELESYAYAPSGSFTRTDTLGTYSYTHPNGIGGPNAVASAGDRRYLYDARGNVVQRDFGDTTQILEYTSFNLPRHVTTTDASGSRDTEFTYSALGQRARKADDASSTYYVANLYREQVNTTDEHRFYEYSLFVNQRKIGVLNKGESDSSESATYFIDDTVGTPLAISTGSEPLEFTDTRAYGEPAASGSIYAKRFGGHDFDEDLGLHDMHGRLYDPYVGRFMTADPFVQEPMRSDSLNRYAYGWNNPLSYVDPTGFQTEEPPVGESGTGWIAGGEDFRGIVETGGTYGQGTMGTQQEETRTMLEEAGSIVWHFMGGADHALLWNVFLNEDLEPDSPIAFYVGQLTGSGVGVLMDFGGFMAGLGIMGGGAAGTLLLEIPSFGSVTVPGAAVIVGGAAVSTASVGSAVVHVYVAEEAIAGLRLAFAKRIAGDDHHISTNKNSKSALRGGPWTPRFADLFKKAGMKLNDPLNRVRVPGHHGPHPEAYHRAVFQRLSAAVKDLQPYTQAYRDAFQGALAKLKAEILTPGSFLNKLLTQ